MIFAENLLHILSCILKIKRFRDKWSVVKWCKLYIKDKMLEFFFPVQRILGGWFYMLMCLVVWKHIHNIFKVTILIFFLSGAHTHSQSVKREHELDSSTEVGGLIDTRTQ